MIHVLCWAADCGLFSPQPCIDCARDRKERHDTETGHRALIIGEQQELIRG